MKRVFLTIIALTLLLTCISVPSLGEKGDTLIGQTVRIGKYEQDNNKKNGEEAIDWIVLAEHQDLILLISKYGLDGKAYGTAMDTQEYSDPSISWKTCQLRKWLNSDFINQSFSKEEQGVIAEVKNKTIDAFGTLTTKDKAFCISAAQAKKYFKSDKKMACKPTNYAKSKLKVYQGAVDEKGYCQWWLRDMISVAKAASQDNFMSNTFNEAAYVYTTKGLQLVSEKKGSPIFCDYLVTVRPAMWIQKSAVGNIAKRVDSTPAKSAEKPLSLSVKEKTLNIGNSVTIKVNNFGSNKVTWSSSNKSIATVTSQGVVKAMKAGNAVITATIGKTQLKAKIKVLPKMSLSVTKKTLTQGESGTIKVNNAGNNKVTWSSSNKSVATVSGSGVVKAVKGGTATITATIGNTKLKSVITVKNKPASKSKSSPYMSDSELIQMAKGYFVLCGGVYENISGASIEHSGNISYVYLAYNFHCYVVKLNRKTGVGLGLSKLF